MAAQYPRATIHGIDSDPAEVTSCEVLAQKLQLNNVTFETTSLLDIAFRQQFDLVYAIHVLEYVEQDTAVLAQLHDALRPKGILLLDVIEPRLGADPRFGMRRFMTRVDRPAGFVRHGYDGADLHHIVESQGFHVLGFRYALAPPALFAHTVFEFLRVRHFRLYLILLPALRLLAYTDFMVQWNQGASFMLWAIRDEG